MCDSLSAVQVEEMIEEAKQESEGVIDPSMAELPLIRLRTEYSGFDKLNVQRFGQPFVGRVANPDSILLFFKTRANVRKSEKKKKSAQDAGSEAMMVCLYICVCMRESVLVCINRCVGSTQFHFTLSSTLCVYARAGGHQSECRGP
jgi:hypothetical protein